MTALQMIETATDEAGAKAMLEWLSIQVDYLGGRILAPGPGKPTWRVQAFFEDAAELTTDHMPDGIQRVTILDGQRRTLGLTADPPDAAALAPFY